MSRGIEGNAERLRRSESGIPVPQADCHADAFYRDTGAGGFYPQVVAGHSTWIIRLKTFGNLQKVR